MSKQPHRYDYMVQPGSAPDQVIRMVGADRRVLELGTGPGSITRHLHAQGCRVTALERDAEALERVMPFCQSAHACNLDDPDWPDLLANTDTFAVIVAADVLEHLHDPWATLRQALPLLAKDGSLVVSLPHVGHNAVIACLLDSDFAYQPCGLLDDTHLRFWGLKNMQRLFADAGCKIVEAKFVVRTPAQTEFAHQWRKLPASFRTMLADNRFGNIYQVVIRAVPLCAPGTALELHTLPIPAPAARLPGEDPSVVRGLLRRCGAYLDPAMQTRIVRGLRTLGLWPQSRK